MCSSDLAVTQDPLTGGTEVDAAGGLVTESFANGHMHLDKVYTLDRIGDAALTADEIARHLQRFRPPLHGEAHILHRSALRAPTRRIERQHQALEAMRRQHEQGLDRPGELFRREHFEEHLRREAALSQREHREFALVLLAIDRIEAMRQGRGEAAVQRVVEVMGQIGRAHV